MPEIQKIKDSFTQVFTGERPALLISTQNRTQYIDGITMFVEMNNCFPSNISFDNIKIPNIVETIKEKWGVSPENIIEGLYPEHKEGEIKYIHHQLGFMIKRDLMIVSYGGRDDSYDFKLYYCHTTNKELVKEVSDYFNSNYINTRNAEIGIIGHGPNGLFVRFFRVNVPNVTVPEYYNDDFVEIHNKILDKLKNNNFNKGVILFHGKPGTGKCVDGNTIVTLKNKKTNKIENISIENFNKSL